jgi:hypothetical protein
LKEIKINVIKFITFAKAYGELCSEQSKDNKSYWKIVASFIWGRIDGDF